MRLISDHFRYLLSLCCLFPLLAIAASNYNDITTTQFNSNSTAVVVNQDDPNSINVAEYYRKTHHIPKSNMVYVSIENPHPRLNFADFVKLKSKIIEQLTPEHKAVLFVWSKPYAVECYSITSAFTLGFNASLCKNTCSSSAASPYFNRLSQDPMKDFNMRLSMLLPTDDFKVATQVIDNGLNSLSGVFNSTAYFIKTNDAARNSRAKFFPKDGLSLKGLGLSVSTQATEMLEGMHDIMIYHTGKAWVPSLESLHFLPGALADHLTSYGGDLGGDSQMTVLSWLKAGATASYGTVSEPCNYWQKFPNSTALLKWYASGATAIEAYWKSVAWPAQGLFVGDPLAAPYAH